MRLPRFRLPSPAGGRLILDTTHAIMPTEREFLDFAAGILGIPPPEAAMSLSCGSIPQWDSVMHIRLVLELEEHFGFQVPVGEIAEVKTLGGLYGYARTGK